MDQNKVTLSDRNGRYLLVFSFVSVIVLIISKSFDIINNSLNNIYITEQGVGYIKMSQLTSVIILILSILLLVSLIRYCYVEASVFITKDSEQEYQDKLKNADRLYGEIFIYIKQSIIFFTLFCLLGKLVETSKLITLMQKNYAIMFVCVLSIGYFITEIIMRKLLCINYSIFYSISIWVLLVIFCMSSVLVLSPYAVNGNISINYEKSNIIISLDANQKFEQLLISVNNQEVQNINMKDEKIYFTSTYITKEAENTNTMKECSGSNYVKDLNSDYYFYTIKKNISKYVKKGKNIISIKIIINDRVYNFINPLNFNGQKYYYTKEQYNTAIKIK